MLLFDAGRLEKFEAQLAITAGRHDEAEAALPTQSCDFWRVIHGLKVLYVLFSKKHVCFKVSFFWFIT